MGGQVRVRLVTSQTVIGVRGRFVTPTRIPFPVQLPVPPLVSTSTKGKGI